MIKWHSLEGHLTIMLKIHLILILSLVICIECNSLLAGHQPNNLNEISATNNSVSHHNRRHDMQTHEKPLSSSLSSAQWLQFMSDDPNSYVGNIDQQPSDESHSRRTKFRHRKMLGNKRHSIRRGQRHRNNKNGMPSSLAQSAQSDMDTSMNADNNNNKMDEDDINDIGLWPPVFNVAPKAIFHVNGTCGQNTREEFCHTIDAHPQRQQRKAKCGICDSHDAERMHPIEYVIDGSQKWWQSPTLNNGPQYEYITITMDLKQVYQVIYVSLKSAISPRPTSWVLERSFDGIDFIPWQYFGANDDDCRNRFNLPGRNEPYALENDVQLICSTQFARTIPLENGEIHVKLLEGRPGGKTNATSSELLDFTLAKFIRIRFQGMHTTTNSANNIQWMVDKKELNKRSFYSLRYIKIGARLDCNGHALRAKQYNDNEITECDCAHNACGINCEKCCPLYNQKPYKIGVSCTRCECYGHSTECYYNPEVDQKRLSINTDGVYSGGGVCLNCTDLTTGINCEKCMANYYRPFGVAPNAKEPCIACDCHPIGSIGPCASIGGACICRQGFTGPKCSECAPGYRGENCAKCACDRRGTMPGGECESHCQCKLYVEGENCDKCIAGYFGLSEANAEGCIPCYCSGVSESCESSNIVTSTYETLDDWKITDVSKSLLMLPSKDNETGTLVFNTYEMFETDSIYWLAPDLYVANKLQSYGSNIIFMITWVVVRGDTSGKPTFGPTIILCGENGMKIAYGDNTFPGTNSTITIRLTEHNWYHIPSSMDATSIGNKLRRSEYHGDKVSRVQFLSVLRNIDSMMLRGTFHSDQVESNLIRVILKSNRQMENENEIGSNLVEQCKCPIGYTGLSCENCDFGYVRTSGNSTLDKSLCLPCSCNGHVEFCDLSSNKCGQCLHETAGERCDRCADGFYGNAKMGTPNDCKRCACPLPNEENNFSPICQLKEMVYDNQNEVTNDYGLMPFQNTEFLCTQCPDGYIGDHCESCADGYYGNPTKPFSKCTKCSCNGGPCDPVTGKCVTCQGNTEGWRCERCKAGHFGNPGKGCELCRCHEFGSENSICDSESGQCQCKKNYAGYHCDECAFGFANVSLDCPPCNCNISGSIQQFCDTRTGQCPCKMGVEGLKCDECFDGFFGLSEDGCQECHCNPTGSLSQTCNKHNGQCRCRKNIIGRTCDRCSEGYWNLDSGTGCHSCECNEIGSTSFNCSAHTGQCNCKPGVGGPKCDSCLDGFYGFSANGCKRCDTCSNSAYNCDSKTGRCVCPPHSKGIDCSQCMPNSYGYSHKNGCKLCDCDHGGSIGQSCDLYTGQCVCREGFTGRRCDRCSIGFFDYPHCERCSCDLEGSIPASNASEPISCDESGQCACKTFVTGLKCDACIPSTFGLTRKNPDGCSKCFCFDRSSDCKQSDLSWGIIRTADFRCLSVEYQNIEFVTIQTMNQDNLISYEANLSTVNGLSMIPGTAGNVSIGSSRGFEVPLYFELPKQFLGDRLLSYAGQFKFSIEMQECKTELDTMILEQFPLVRIHSHNYMTLDYYGPEILQANSNVSYNLRFTEVGWRSHSDNVPVTRELFMTALQNITHILVRATTSVAFTRLTLSNISLETAIFLSGSRNNLAIGIELCNCPQQYNGTSCQNPAAGFYRHRAEMVGNKKETIEDFIGESVPCQCNGRTDVCDIETGYCQMCGNNTGGPSCDVCTDGYYGSPNDYGCEPCPCPTTQQNFAKGCTFHHGRVRCACKPGYAGDLCEYCAKGYYQNSREFDGGCMDCECHPDGSISTECDIKTGQCMCKDGVTGKRCDKCKQSKSTLRNGDCQVCDNCTLTLLASSDDLGYMMASDTTLMDLNEVPAPWPRLSMFENSTNHLKKKLIDVMSARERLENYNDLQIDKMNTKSTNVNAKWQKVSAKALKRSNASGYLKMSLMNFLTEIHSIHDEAQDSVNQLNQLGLATHHINIPTALDDSKTMLQHILEFVDTQNGAFRAHQCANSQLEQWSNISAILISQTEEAEQMKYDVINTKNRIYDLINRSYETTNILSEVNGLYSAGEKGFDKLRHKVKRINLIRTEIKDLQNTSIIPQTYVQINMIVDDHGKIRQDLSNLVRLKTIVQETNAQTSQQISHLRNEWLPIARKYSTGLMGRAKEYVQLFQDTKHSAEAAMLASTAYKNITESIQMARQLAIEAGTAASNSENDLYPKNSDSIIEKSMKSLKKSHKIHQNALREIKKTEDLEFIMNTQKRKVDSIKNSIWQTGLRNNNISLALNTFSKNDTQEFLRRTIEQANKVSDQMRDVRRAAVDVMTSDVYKLKFKLNSLEPQWAVKFGRAAENVSQSLRNIKNIKNTLSTIETVSARNDEKFRKWNQTMSSSMQELKDKITKARHIAEGIRVSMESKAKCIRSYSPPTFGLFTSNTIKFTIALKSKSITSSILFLQGEDNRFLAIEMVNRKIRFAWNVGGNTVSVTHSLELHKKNLEYDDAWYQIEVNRTMNVGSLTVRQMGTESNKPIVTVTSASQSEYTRIVFSPANRLWVGGVPNDIKPAAGLIAHDAGLNVILSNIYVDGKQLGLWNFMHTEGECDGAMFGAREITTNNNIRHFNGHGYSVVKKERSKPYKKNFFALQLLVKTFDENALLFMAIDERNKRSILLTLHSGRIVYRIDYGNDIRLEINTTKKYNTGQWISIEVAREFTSKRSTENGSLKVNNEEPLTGSPTTPITSSLLPDFSRSSFYLGGVPPGYEYVNAMASGADNAFLGCMKDIQINGETYDPLETSNRYGVEAACKEVISKAGFHGNGYLELPNHSLRKRANVGFVFRTLQSNALLMFADVPQSELADNYFDDKDLRSNYSFYLTNGRLIFWADAGRGRVEMMSNNTVNDGEYHTVNVLKSGRKFELRIDDEYQMSKSLTTHPFVINMIEDAGGLYVGGAPDGVDIQGLQAKLNRFHGTMKDFVINNQSISLSSVVNFTNVNIGHEGPQMGSGHHFNDLLMKTEPAGKNALAVHEGCHRFGAYSYEPNAFKFGDAAQSYAVVSAAKSLWQNDFDVQFDFRTYYPNGLLFVVPGTKEKKKHFFTLVLRNGQINVIARSRKRIESTMPRKLNDGQWHRVSLKCINKQLTIRVQSEDENSSVDVEVMKMPRRISVSNVMYVGGMIDNTLSFELTAKLEQFKGCIRRFILNNTPQDLARPGRNVGIGQCFPNVEKGSYFAGDAYATYKRIFQVGKYLELGFEFRTSEMNGVILSVSEPNGFPAMSIELHKGKIVMSCDLGDGIPFRIESNLSKFALCDNRWHNISAIYDSNQIAIRVDDLPMVNKLKQHDVLSKVNTKSPLYIGGIPETAASGTLLSRENFKGCIRNVVIMNELRDWTDMDDLQNVLLSECLTEPNIT